MDAIVILSLGFAVALSAGYLFSPALRRWIEQPKHRFQENLVQFEQARRSVQK